MSRFDELGFYTLAGHRATLPRPRRGGPPTPRRWASGPCSSPSAQHQGGGDALRRGRRGQRAHRGSQTAATNHNTRHPMVTAGVRARRCTASPAAGSCSASGGASTAMFRTSMGMPHDHDRPDGGLRRAHAPALARRGRSSATTVPPAVARPRTSTPTFDEHIPMAWSRSGPNDARARRSLLRRGRAPHVLHRRDAPPRCVRTVKRGRRGKPGGTPRRPRVVVLRHHRRPHRPSDCGSRSRSAGWPPTCRATATCWCAPTAGIPPCWSASGPTRSSPASAAPSTRSRPPSSSSTSPRCSPTSGWPPAATGTPEQCVAAVRHQFDLGCDGVILHGASPTELAPVVDAVPRRRWGSGGDLRPRARNDDAVLRNGVTAGRAAFLAKPITPGVLARKVRLVLDEKG